jgi:hypothetical protein
LRLFVINPAGLAGSRAAGEANFRQASGLSGAMKTLDRLPIDDLKPHLVRDGFAGPSSHFCILTFLRRFVRLLAPKGRVGGGFLIGQWRR